MTQRPAWSKHTCCWVCLPCSQPEETIAMACALGCSDLCLQGWPQLYCQHWCSLACSMGGSNRGLPGAAKYLSQYLRVKLLLSEDTISSSFICGPTMIDSFNFLKQECTNFLLTFPFLPLKPAWNICLRHKRERSHFCSVSRHGEYLWLSKNDVQNLIERDVCVLIYVCECDYAHAYRMSIN